MTDKEKIKAEIERRRNIVNNAALQMKDVNLYYHYSKIVEEYDDIIRFIDSSKEPVSEDLEKAAVEAFKQIVDGDKNNFLEIFKAGANWRKQQMINKGAEWLRKGLDNGMWVDQFLSEKDKEAIVLTYKENMEEEFKL